MARILFILSALISFCLGSGTYASTGTKWTSLGKEAESLDSIMEHAVFVDMPKRDLQALASELHMPANATDTRQARARIYFWKGRVIVKDDPQSAMRLAKEAIALCDSARYPYDHARFSLLIADCHRYSGSFANAYFLYRDKIDKLKQFNDDFWTAKAMVCLGVILQNLGEYHEANAYYSRAQSLFEKTGSRVSSTKNLINLANTSYLLGDKEKGLSFLKGLESNKHVTNDSIYIANVLVSRFHISEYHDTAAARKAYEISRHISDDNLSVISRIALGISSFNEGKLREAIDYYNIAYNLADKLNDYPNKRSILEGLEKCYIALDNPDSAGVCRQQILSLNDSIYYRESIDNLKRAEYLSTINDYELTLKRQREQHRLRTIMTMSLIVFLVIVLVLSLWLLWTSKQKSTSERRIQEDKNRRLELQNRQYSIEIEAKEKEIASKTVILAQKNAKLKELSQQIGLMEKQGEIANDESRTLNERITNELSNDDDWKYFKLRFDEMHPFFFASLKEAYPNLSKTELRLCAYIRVGMRAKEIAQVLSVRPETVNTSRYRIRRKMQLDQQTSLEETLLNF